MSFGLFKGILVPISCAVAHNLANEKYTSFYMPHFKHVSCDTSMKLVYASVYFRHGTRTPIWIMDDFKDREYPKSLVYNEDDPLKPSLPHKIINIENNTEGAPLSFFEKLHKERPLKGGCVCGQLTKKGWQDSISLGGKLASRYIEEYKLIDATFNHTQVRNYSTNLFRTLESIKGVLIGMFGSSISEENPAVIYTRPIEVEYNFPNNLFSSMLKEYAKWAYGTEYAIPQCADLKEKIYSTFKNPSTIKISELWDNINSLISNDLTVSDEIRSLRDEMEGCVSRVEKKASFGENPKIMKCSFGKVLDDILTGFESVPKGKSDLKLSLTACHDTTLMALLTAAGGFKAKWPELASFISFELFQNSSDEKYYVRVIFDGEVIKGAMADEEGFVPLEIFVEKQEPIRLRESWTGACLP